MGLCLLARRFAAALRTFGSHTPPAAVILRRQALWKFPAQSTLRPQLHAQGVGISVECQGCSSQFPFIHHQACLEQKHKLKKARFF